MGRKEAIPSLSGPSISAQFCLSEEEGQDAGPGVSRVWRKYIGKGGVPGILPIIPHE